MIIGTYLTYLSLVLFSFSLDKHFREAIKKNSNGKYKLLAKILGTILLICSIVIFVKSVGLSVGLTYWIGILAVEVLLIAFVYTYAPKTIIKLSVLLFLISLVASIL